MTQETLAIIWFALWGLIWAVYFVLDGYTTGTGMLFPFLAKNKQEERQLQETVGPFWGGNEVWLITAGGATFAAFPKTYALMFSYLYVPLFLILFALFFRAIGLEFMHKHETARWKNFWKWSFFAGSGAIALLFGVAFANLFLGLKFDKTGSYVNLLNLLNGYGILGGITFVSLFLLSGALWIAVKTEGTVQQRARVFAGGFWYAAAACFALFIAATANKTPLFANYLGQSFLWLVPLVSLLAILAAKGFLLKERLGMAFAAVSVNIFTFIATGFIGLFPNMLPSRLDPAASVTLFDAAASALNLKIMFLVALFIVPVVILYQLWMYRIFRAKITAQNAKGYR